MFRQAGIFTVSLACAALAACSAQHTRPITADRVIEAPRVIYVPIDPRLTALVPPIAAFGPTCGQAVATAQARAQALAAADAKLAAIATVQGTEATDYTCRPKAEASISPADRPGHE